ncbi:hypothetical protein MF672_011740 [Actinomadura sp. ATCC 31491]|uniref:WD40 repeat domain-containing protein n=1 Tax=Actinomadura luzonensis TaxID=2805427 RepID=A0ABT0FRA3_9ACTN|nr:hypothetical protein [Actinomadura luzonensis]MCK2214456.1 hypothetical protein [Actinomadura luzonensis]
MTEDKWVEGHLRSTLRHAAAGGAPQAPVGLPGRVAARARARRRNRGRLGLALAGVAAAVVVVPVAAVGTGPGFGGGLGGDGPGGDGRGVSTGRLESGPPAPSPGLESRRPLGERLIVDNPSENRPLQLWFARREDGSVAFCRRYESRTGGSTSSCGDAPVAGTASLEGSTESWPPPERVMYFGAAGDRVAGVSAVTAEGRRTAGRVTHPAGAPLSIWRVSTASAARVDFFEFVDAEGKVVARVDNTPLMVPEATAEPVGEVLRLGDGLSANVYDVPDRTLIWRLDGEPVGSDLVRAKDLMRDLGGRRLPVLLHERDRRWFGVVADVRTAEVELVFADGRKVRAPARKDPWGIGVRLFGGAHERDGDIYLKGFQVVGRDAEGRELWRDAQPARTSGG